MIFVGLSELLLREIGISELKLDHLINEDDHLDAK